MRFLPNGNFLFANIPRRGGLHALPKTMFDIFFFYSGNARLFPPK